LDTDPKLQIRRLEKALGAGAHTDARVILQSMYPADVADAFVRMKPIQRSVLVSLYDDEELADFIEYLPVTDAVDVLEGLTEPEQAAVFHELPDDHMVDLLQEMEPDQQKESIELLSEGKKETAEDLLRFPDDSAGGRMTTAFASVRADMTVREAIHELEQIKEETELLSRIYVVDENNRILGKVRLRDLTFSKRSVLISEIMDNETLAVKALADQEEAVQMMARYDLMAVPVVNDDLQLLGLITHDDAFDIQEEETTEDIEKQSGIVGAPVEESYLQTSVGVHIKRRLGWALVLAVLAISSGFVLENFGDDLKRARILMIYLPMVVAAGGNTGGQAATMVIRAMALGELTPGSLIRVVWKEFRIGALIGAVIGLSIGVQIFFSMGGIDENSSFSIGRAAVAVAISLAAQIGASTMIGSALPMLAKAARLDPAVVATPAITTIVDVTGLLIYFGCARLILF
jgi:magnesium transporter